MFALLQALRHYPRIGLAPAIVLPQAITQSHLECYLPNAHPLVCWAPKFSQTQPGCNTKLVYNDCARLYISPLRCYNAPPSPSWEATVGRRPLPSLLFKTTFQRTSENWKTSENNLQRFPANFRLKPSPHIPIKLFHGHSSLWSPSLQYLLISSDNCCTLDSRGGGTSQSCWKQSPTLVTPKGISSEFVRTFQVCPRGRPWGWPPARSSGSLEWRWSTTSRTTLIIFGIVLSSLRWTS